jgi:Arm DNA-binding domain
VFARTKIALGCAGLVCISRNGRGREKVFCSDRQSVSSAPELLLIFKVVSPLDANQTALDCISKNLHFRFPPADRALTGSRVMFWKGAFPMRTKLTPAFCQKARAQDGAERTLYWDADMPGFGLVVTSTGHRSYVVQYRAGRRSRRMTIDGVLGLAAARKRAKGLLGEVARDRDPLQERRKTAALTENTFQSIAADYLARDGKKLRTVDQRRVILERLVYPRLGSQQIDDIRRSDLVKMLDQIEDANGPVMADRTLATISRIMNWHASRSDEFRSPIVRGMARTSGKDRARERILTDDELRTIWKAAEATPGPFGAFVQFLLLTGARRSEAAGMTHSELAGADWTLPADRNKVKVDLIRPILDGHSRRRRCLGCWRRRAHRDRGSRGMPSVGARCPCYANLLVSDQAAVASLSSSTSARQVSGVRWLKTGNYRE